MNKKLLLLILLAYGLLDVESTFAAIQLDENLRPDNLPSFETVEEATSEDNPETRATQTLILFVGNLVSQVLLFAGAITILFLIIAGANYIFAFGKDQLIEKGKKGIFWSLMGLLVIILSYALVQGAIQLILKVDEAAN